MILWMHRFHRELLHLLCDITTPFVCVAMDHKKSLPLTGIDPTQLAFKASVLACFKGKCDQTHTTCFQGN